MIKLSLHHKIALTWLACSPAILAPALDASTFLDVSTRCFLLVMCVTVAILLAPKAVQVSPLRRWYAWRDVMSLAQIHALQTGSVSQYYSLSSRNGYKNRVKPYLIRLSSTVLVLEGLYFALDEVFHASMALVALLSLVLYIFGVVLVVMISVPWREAKKSSQ